ncbi:hypothetical protein K437DRAFT_256756 [Tilletiaria anomala UBC 951]|uniref:Spindle pole body component n=1 Tax=Tilletiaria anomala (strain ATCC 24038 / CBS 436.72 / UBC 951) TaxID=1037660 RepID=A0A066VTP1_TILAU|nr:uncharacterized protein K437DRAFT_256756 [Tilletiaria anomala UBC 951]KDN45097.1 hypothetical protein K437DRAFT_256756 [Tilletiaria anomala UBC 951]
MTLSCFPEMGDIRPPSLSGDDPMKFDALSSLPSPFQVSPLPPSTLLDGDPVLQSWLKAEGIQGFSLADDGADSLPSVDSRPIGANSRSEEHRVLSETAVSVPTIRDAISSGPLKSAQHTAESRNLDPCSRTWDDWYHICEVQNDESMPNSGWRAAPRPARLLSDMTITQDNDAYSRSLLEALVLETEGFQLAPASSEGPQQGGSPQSSQYVTRRPAPSYEMFSVLRSLLLTASTGNSSELFQWDPKRAAYRWSGAMQQKKRAELYLEHVKSILKGKARDPSGQNNPPIPSFEDWAGTERIAGLSLPASEASISACLEVGSLLRRLVDRVAALRNAAGGDSAPEVGAMCHAVEVVVEYVQQCLTAWNSSVAPERESKVGLVRLKKDLAEIKALLGNLASLMNCSLRHRPPFKMPCNLRDSSSVLTHVYAHYSSLAASSPPMIQHTLMWILEKTSHAWRNDLAAWVGWPGAKASKMQNEIGEDGFTNASERGIGHASSRGGSRCGSQRKLVPWAGARVEWTLDARGEEDVGYTLLPAKLPTFISIEKARSLLEAGRALRLLRKAADSNHPLLKELDSLEADAALDLPSWLSSPQAYTAKQRQLMTRIKELQYSIAMWRKGRGGFEEALARDQPSTINLTRGAAVPDLSVASAALHNPARLLARLNAASSMALPEDECVGEEDTQGKASSEMVEFKTLIAPVADSLGRKGNAAGRTPSAQVSNRPAQQMLNLLLQWSKLINAALISVFFRDLGFPAYLETCRQFLLLGSQSFSHSMQELLFSDGISDEGQQRLLRSGEAPLRAPAEGLSKLLASEGWPPPAGQFTPRFNAAVIEVVSVMRESGGSYQRTCTLVPFVNRGHQATRDALKDLDERLSFALVDPSVSRIRGHSHSKWQEPDSIDALDWLTLSFHPPSLIAPLLTQQAQLSYQRILNFLLRIMRVKVVLRGLHLRLVKLRSHVGTSIEIDQSALYAFQHLAQHFMAALGGYVEQVAVDDVWRSFQLRLEQLQRDAESQDDSFLLASDGQDEMMLLGDADDGAGNSTVFGGVRGGGSSTVADVLDFAGEGSSAKGAAAGTAGGSRTAMSAPLKDVFSIARYHERVLDRIIVACFQKQRQGALSGLMNELFDLVLAFSSVLRQCEEERGDASRPALLGRAYSLGSRFEKKFAVLVRALRIIERCGRKSYVAAAGGERQGGRARAPPNLTGGASLDAAAAEEVAKLEEEAQEDLRMLERESWARKSSSESELAAQLLARLDLAGVYV